MTTALSTAPEQLPFGKTSTLQITLAGDPATTQVILRPSTIQPDHTLNVNASITALLQLPSGALLRVDGPVEVGHEVYHPSDPEQPAGLVADAAPQPGGQGVWHAVASLQTAAMDGQPLRIGSPQGPLAHLLPLPYPLRDDL